MDRGEETLRDVDKVIELGPPIRYEAERLGLRPVATYSLEGGNDPEEIHGFNHPDPIIQRWATWMADPKDFLQRLRRWAVDRVSGNGQPRLLYSDEHGLMDLFNATDVAELHLRRGSDLLDEALEADTRYGMKEKMEEALVELDEGVRLNPNDYQIYYHRASAYAWLDRSEEVLQNLDRALDPSLPDPYHAPRSNPDHPIHELRRWAVERVSGDGPLWRFGFFGDEDKELLKRYATKSPLDGHALMELFNREPGIWIKPIKQYLQDLVLDGALEPHDVERARELALGFVESHAEVELPTATPTLASANTGKDARKPPASRPSRPRKLYRPEDDDAFFGNLVGFIGAIIFWGYLVVVAWFCWVIPLGIISLILREIGVVPAFDKWPDAVGIGGFVLTLLLALVTRLAWAKKTGV